MTVTQTIYLQQTNFQAPPIVRAVQGDSGRTLRMIIADETVPAASTASLAIWRPNDTHYNISCTYQGDNVFTADISQALTQAGKVKCQLKVTGLVSTYTFFIDVQEDVSGTPTEEQSESFDALLAQLQQAYEVIETFEGGVPYTTVAPTEANTSGTLKFVVLSSEPATRYNGYFYIITA